MARDALDVACVAAQQPGCQFFVQAGLDAGRAPEGFAQAGQAVVGLEFQPDQAGTVGQAVGAQAGDRGHG